MPKPAPHQNHRSIPAGTCLVTSLADELVQYGQSQSHLQPQSYCLSDVHVVLPTQRLQLYLTRELALRLGGAAILPRMWTWDQFAQNLTMDYAPTQLVMGSRQCDLIMEFVLQEISKKSPPDHRCNTNPRHAHELFHLHAELTKTGVRHLARQRLLDRLDGEWRRSPEAHSAMTARVNDVFNALDQFSAQLEALGWTTNESARAEAIAQWLEDPSHANPNPANNSLAKNTTAHSGRTIIAGLTSLPAKESALLGLLSTRQGVEIWLDEPPPWGDASPLASLRSAVGLPKTNAKTESWAQGVQAVTAAVDVTHEVAHAFHRVAELLKNGASPHELAIIVPDETVHGPALDGLKDALMAHVKRTTNTNLTVNIPLATPWVNTIPGRWMSLVTDVALSYETSLVGQYILHPLTRKLFGAPENFSAQIFQRKLKDLPAIHHGVWKPLTDFLRQFFRSDDSDYILRSLRWTSRFEDNNSVASASGEIARLVQLIESSSFALLPRDKSAWTILAKSAEQVAALEPLRGAGVKDWVRFLRDVHGTACAQSVRDTGEPLSGLQIISLTEARYVPFKWALILGCVEGSFPHALPRDSLIDNTMRQAMGISGWSELEALEDTTFHLLTCRLPAVELTFAHTDAESPQIKSRWIERLATRLDSRIEIAEPNVIELHDLLSPQFEAKARTELSKQFASKDLEGLSSDHEALTATTSASRLRHLLWCPYRYLLQERKIEAIELPEDRASITIGHLLHRVLELFFAVEDLAGVPADLALKSCPSQTQEFVRWAGDRLHAIAHITIPKSMSRNEQFQQMTAKGWQDVATFWGQLILAGFDPKSVTTEVAIGKTKHLTMRIGDRDIGLHGSIDAVHTKSGATLLVDYKTSSTPELKTTTEGLEPQLPLYAYAVSNAYDQENTRNNPDIANIATAYYSLQKGEAKFSALGSKIKTLLLDADVVNKSNKNVDLAATIDAVKNRWLSRLNIIKSNARFEADPSDCAYCAYSGICRKDDPRHRDRIKQQATAGKS